LAENDAAMKKMMTDMSAKTTGGDVDVDFVAMMELHHQGAIEWQSRRRKPRGPGSCAG
jgi:uncharacterized protein (DUF305 family)